ncbi:unnamed protein product [Knipowitschia caucasica]
MTENENNSELDKSCHRYTVYAACNVWIDHSWTHSRLSWNMTEFDGIDMLRLPSNMLWLPEIVLENNSLTYNAKEIRIFLKEDVVEDNKFTLEWIVIDPAGWTVSNLWSLHIFPVSA